MSLFKQPVVSGVVAPTKRKPVKKDIPLPIIVPEALFVAIKLSCVVHAIDENPRNRLNENRDPIVRSYTRKNRETRFVCYTPEFIKSWLRVLLVNPVWRDTVEVPKATKGKFGVSSLSSVERINVSCIRIPSDEEIRLSVDGNEDMVSAMRLARDVVKDILLGTKDLLYRDDIALGQVPDPATIASPSNICRVSRLETLGMTRTALSPSEKKRWDDFYRSEKARLAYVSNMMSSTRISDSILKGLNESEAAEYNKQMMETAALSMGAGALQQRALEEAIVMRSKGSKVNPALVHLYDTASRVKTTKEGKVNVMDQYKAMCKKYFTLTGHRLDPTAEKKASTYDLRIEDIRWADNIRESNPLYSFVHYGPTDRIRAVQGVMVEDSSRVAAKGEEPKSPKYSGPPRDTKSSKMFSTGKHAFTSSSIYSTFKPVVTKVPASKIQEQMNRKTKVEESDESEEDDAFYGDDAESGGEAQHQGSGTYVDQGSDDEDDAYVE